MFNDNQWIDRNNGEVDTTFSFGKTHAKGKNTPADVLKFAESATRIGVSMQSVWHSARLLLHRRAKSRGVKSPHTHGSSRADMGGRREGGDVGEEEEAGRRSHDWKLVHLRPMFLHRCPAAALPSLLPLPPSSPPRSCPVVIIVVIVAAVANRRPRHHHSCRCPRASTRCSPRKSPLSVNPQCNRRWTAPRTPLTPSCTDRTAH